MTRQVYVMSPANAAKTAENFFRDGLAEAAHAEIFVIDDMPPYIYYRVDVELLREAQELLDRAIVVESLAGGIPE